MPGRVDTFQKLVAVADAIITTWGAYVMVETDQKGDRLREIESRLISLKEELSWAKELYVRFDDIVSSKVSEHLRLPATNA